MRLRSIEMNLPRASEARDFFTGIWGLADAGPVGQTHYLRASDARGRFISMLRRRMGGS